MEPAERQQQATSCKQGTNGSNNDHSSSGAGQQVCLECAKKEAEICKLRHELRALEGEMDEMHDNVKEEESEQFEQLKQELDLTLKNCKILQIKLNKSERQYGQLEQVKSMLEQQMLEESQRVLAPRPQQQLAGPGKAQQQQQQAENVCLFELAPGQDHVKLATCEYDQLLRDLNDTSERERDLQEQIKFSQEEAQLKGERLQAVEGENEILLERIGKLTNANSSLRATLLSNQRIGASETAGDCKQQVRELVEQGEQLKLALELAQAEGVRLRARLAELQQQQQAPLGAQRLPMARDHLEDGLQSAAATSEKENDDGTAESARAECRRLRARLVRTEREQRQLRARLEATRQETASRTAAAAADQQAGARQAGQLGLKSRSMEEREANECRSAAKCQARIRQLASQLEEATSRRARELEGAEPSQMECDLLDKLKRQLEASESELAKARSQLVELDIECSKAQRQHRRLLDSFEACGSQAELQSIATRRLKLVPSEAVRESMSRADLRQALRALESDLDELTTMVRAKECLAREQRAQLDQLRGAAPGDSSIPNVKEAQQAEVGAGNSNESSASLEGQQLKSLRRILDQERLLSNNLKLDVANLERELNELQARNQWLERERSAMDEELERLRRLVGEIRAELEQSQQEKCKLQARGRDLGETIDRLHLELKQAKEAGAASEESKRAGARLDGLGVKRAGPTQTMVSDCKQGDELLVLARDLSELKVKNGFLMRQLELARDESQRQLEEARAAHEAQQRRAVELGQLEVRERQLAQEQQFKEELGELEAKLQAARGQLARHEEELALERERARALERDSRRDKSSWQQAREQLESQLAIERRSSEFKLKEIESVIRDKERSQLGLQDKCVQLERDSKRLQNKMRLPEEDSEMRLKATGRELECKARELQECLVRLQASEAQQAGQQRRLADDNKQLNEALDSIKQSYELKLGEGRKLREMLAALQEQSFRERQQGAEQVADLARRLNEALEGETQAKLLRQRLEALERQLEGARRDLAQVREERAKLRGRCEELERRELQARTSTISSGATSILRPFVGRTAAAAAHQQQQAPLLGSAPQRSAAAQSRPDSAATSGHRADAIASQTIEKLSGKINDQRNLIQMLRQQLSETQLELRQLKVLQASELSRWQTRASILTSRLNQCEERLAFEMTAASGWFGQQQKQAASIGPDLKANLELQYELERRAQMELLQQQQAQIDSLSRDLKKTSQAHDMLRLQAKQLEASNNKLSKKLIEFQQQQPLFRLAQSELEQRHERLTHSNAKLRAEARPLVEIVSKMVNSLDAPEPQATSGGRTTRASDSTNRPLRAPVLSGDDEQLAAEAAAAAPQSRLSRLLGGRQRAARLSTASPSMGEEEEEEDDDDDKDGHQSLARNSKRATSGAGGAAASQRRPMKRVRVKCSTLGITTGEKRQLKQQLKVVGELLSEKQIPTIRQQQQHSNQINSAQSATSGQPQRQQQPLDNSDLDSERSWSLEPTTRRLDMYRRFPQASPATSRGGGGASLTDYESESSLTSDFHHGSSRILGARSGSTGAAGAESDSGISPGGGRLGAKVKTKHKAGIKGRVASTLRNISRSIQGLASAPASDAEEETSDRRRGANRNTLSEIRV